MERFVQMKRFTKSFHHFRCELWIHGVYLTRFAGGQVYDQKRDDGDKKEGDDLLYDTTTDE